MRLLATFKSQEEGQQRLLFLLEKKILCHFEKANGSYDLWILNEEQFELAKEYLSEFSPKHTTPLAEGIHKAPLQPPSIIPGFYYRSPFTKLFVLLCILIFIVSLYQYALIVKQGEAKKQKEFFFPILTPIQQKLLYDAPPILKLMEEFDQNYTLKTEKDVKKLPVLGQVLFQKIKNEPVWTGIYPKLVGEKTIPAPLFTNIREGEVWRLFTPALLHANIFHILFNMVWLWLLGKMIEHNLGVVRYLVFILIAALVTNTVQYLMSGPFFMGFSGVLAAMAGYIWVRKKNAPWECYPIDLWALKLLGIFIFGLLGVQMVVFILRISHIISFELPFANAAHIVGVFLGMGLGHLRLFRSL